MTRTVIDPVTRIEGHLRVEMEVTNGVVSDAWVSGGCFRGMERVVEKRTPEDAVHIVQRICGVCPVSHAQASAIAAERAYHIAIPNNARIIRNMLEGAQFLHSHILWFYNLAGLDYINPIDGLKSSPADARDLAAALGTSSRSDLDALYARLSKFAENGQLSIFSGNWFDADEGAAYTLPSAANLLLTSHYMEALEMQAKASEINGLLGGKMPHVMTIAPGGTAFVPTSQKLDDLKFLIKDLKEWVCDTMVQDALALVPFYSDALKFGKGCGRYISWGVFEPQGNYGYDEYLKRMADRYLPSGVLDENLNLTDPDESAIKEFVGRSWYKGSDTYQSPYFVTEPDFTGYDVNDRYSWIKRPEYNGKAMEAGPMARILAAYKRGVPEVVKSVDAFLAATGLTLEAVPSTLGRTAIRNLETVYIAQLMEQWCDELIEAVKGGESSYFKAPETITGEGTGFWEAPRGALYHSEKVTDGKIDGYQIIIPSTWNLAPRSEKGELGPLEEALIGVPVETLDKPINALRTVHSFDPCTACAVHVSEPATGRHFETVTTPWGAR